MDAGCAGKSQEAQEGQKEQMRASQTVAWVSIHGGVLSYRDCVHHWAIGFLNDRTNGWFPTIWPANWMVKRAPPWLCKPPSMTASLCRGVCRGSATENAAPKTGKIGKMLKKSIKVDWKFGPLNGIGWFIDIGNKSVRYFFISDKATWDLNVFSMGP